MDVVSSNMGILQKLFGGGSPKTPKDETSEYLFIYSKCAKCGELFRNRIDKLYDVQVSYEDGGQSYRAHKELVGARCRKIVVIDLEFDQQKRLVAKEIQNGQFLTREEYEASHNANTAPGKST